jgi:hypothetical protein
MGMGRGSSRFGALSEPVELRRTVREYEARKRAVSPGHKGTGRMMALSEQVGS